LGGPAEESAPYQILQMSHLGSECHIMAHNVTLRDLQCHICQLTNVTSWLAVVECDIRLN
jgi:hypothetical protein